MTESVTVAIISALALIAGAYFSFLASRRSRLAKEIAESIQASISTTNGGGHLKDDIEEIKRTQRDSAEALAVIKVALVQVQGAQSAQSRDIDRLEQEDSKRAAAAAEAHGRIHERIDDLVQKRRGWHR